MPLHILLVFIHVGWMVISYVMLLLGKSCYDWMVPTLPVLLYCLIGSCVIVFIVLFGRFGRLIQHGWRLVWLGSGVGQGHHHCRKLPANGQGWQWWKENTLVDILTEYVCMCGERMLCLGGAVITPTLLLDRGMGFWYWPFPQERTMQS